MKKDVYPDVRIEIISEGLTKKILEESKGAAPSVYGEEKPEGENLPNIDSKGKNKEMGGLLQVSNKKPTYTSIIKQAMLELRKDAHDEEAGRGGAGSLQRTPKGKYGGIGRGSGDAGLSGYRAQGGFGPSGEGMGEGTSSPLTRSESVKRSVAGGSGTGSSTRRRDPAVFQSTRGDFDMARGPGARVGDTKTTKLNIGAGDSSEETGTSRPKRPASAYAFGSGRMEESIVKEVVSEFLNKGKVWDVRKETWVSKQPQSYGAATPGMGSQFGTSGGGSQPAMGKPKRGQKPTAPGMGRGTSGPRMPKSMSKNLQKQAPPMTTSATKPANMGVGMQQPVVSGAGSMKNIDKAKMNKEPAPAAKRKTAPRPRKNIQAAIIKAATLALEKAKGRQGVRIPKGRQFKQSDDLGRGATTFTETTEKRGKQGMRIPKGRQFKQGDKKSRLGRRGGMSGKQQAPVKRATGGMAETYRG